MNGTSGFEEVRSSTFRSSTNRFLDEQRHQLGTGSWRFLRTKELAQMASQVRVTNPFSPSPATIDSHGNAEAGQTNLRLLEEQWTTRH